MATASASKPRHLFAVPDAPTWFDIAVLSAASRIASTSDARLSPVGRDLKRAIERGEIIRG